MWGCLELGTGWGLGFVDNGTEIVWDGGLLRRVTELIVNTGADVVVGALELVVVEVEVDVDVRVGVVEVEVDVVVDVEGEGEVEIGELEGADAVSGRAEISPLFMSSSMVLLRWMGVGGEIWEREGDC